MDDQQKKTDWKAILKKLHHLEHQLIDFEYLGQSLQETKALLAGFQHEILNSRLEEIESDYQLMTDFFMNGYQDDKREELYDGLVARLYRLLRDIDLAYHKVYDSSVSAHLQYDNAIAFDAESIRKQLESFVSDVALCSLESETVKQDKLKKVYSEHHQYMQHLFDAVIFSPQWNHDFANTLADIISSPTIDSADAQLLVSALMLATMKNCDPERLSALIEIYERAQDIHVQQRALIGWAFAVDDEMLTLFDDIFNRIDQLLTNESVRKDLQELQMQVVYCRNAKRDNDKLQQDIMPTLLKNQNFEITGSGIKPKEVDPMEDILHPEADEKKMEELEETMRKMMDMRDQGVDIYFSGFSQMKRFSFFYTLCNWFMPFIPEHPQLQHLSSDFLNSGMVKAILKSCSFCDSDKYSFVLGTSAVFNNLPANIKEMLNSGEGTIEMMGDKDIDMNDPRFIRRMYLQDLYRFFSLSDFRHLFFNPFDEEEFLFLTHHVFLSRMGNEARRVEKFLLKQKMYTSLSDLYFTYKEIDNTNDLKMEALLYMHEENYIQAQAVYERLCEMLPDDNHVLAGYAQSCYLLGDFSEAAEAYQELYELQPDNNNIAQNLAISLINDNQAEEGVKMLYRLEYEMPDDLNIKRALAWGQMFLGRTEQADALYQTILINENCNASDYLNAGYCYWFSGKISEAVSLIFQSFLRVPQFSKSISEIMDQFDKDSHLFQRYNIGFVEKKLVADRVCALFGYPKSH